MVFDQPEKNRASAVAAGLFNPITGKNLVPAWHAETLFPYLYDFYPLAERYLKQTFFHPRPFYIPFRSLLEQNDWLAKLGKAAPTSRFVKAVHSVPQHPHWVQDPLGGIEVAYGGYVDTHAFLSSVRTHLQQQGEYCEEWFDEQRVDFVPSAALYGHVEARHIVFCTGVHMRSSAYFADLPLVSLKGEVLHLDLSDSMDRIYNRGVYVVDRTAGHTTLGATYARDDSAEKVTPQARAELMEKAEKLLSIPFSVLGQDWGFRPTTVDRRPLLGVHQRLPSLFVFNGLGTQGVSLAPWLSHRMAGLLVGEKEAIPRWANIERVRPRLA